MPVMRSTFVPTSPTSPKELAEKGYTLPEYAFVVECGGATSGESGVLEVRGGLRVVLKNQETVEEE